MYNCPTHTHCFLSNNVPDLRSHILDLSLLPAENTRGSFVTSNWTCDRIVLKLEHIMIIFFMAYFVTTNQWIVAPDRSRMWWSYRRCRAPAAITTAHIYCICPPSGFLCLFSRVAHLREHGNRNERATNSWWRFLWFLGYDVRLWCDTPSLRTGILAFDLCGNMSWGAKPLFFSFVGAGEHAHKVMVS